MGYFDDFGRFAKGSCLLEALEAFAQLTAILGFDLKVEESGNGSEIEVVGAAARRSYAQSTPWDPAVFGSEKGDQANGVRKISPR